MCPGPPHFWSREDKGAQGPAGASQLSCIPGWEQGHKMQAQCRQDGWIQPILGSSSVHPCISAQLLGYLQLQVVLGFDNGGRCGGDSGCCQSWAIKRPQAALSATSRFWPDCQHTSAPTAHLSLKMQRFRAQQESLFSGTAIQGLALLQSECRQKAQQPLLVAACTCATCFNSP